mmetsp:Transcript_15816/g.37415  ORF Transcript_15816/g.37415 Transcript_15816/m.37415 type:complete len:205 (-) Transcript_15816:1141-1755(-)
MGEVERVYSPVVNACPHTCGSEESCVVMFSCILSFTEMMPREYVTVRPCTLLCMKVLPSIRAFGSLGSNSNSVVAVPDIGYSGLQLKVVRTKVPTMSFRKMHVTPNGPGRVPNHVPWKEASVADIRARGPSPPGSSENVSAGPGVCSGAFVVVGSVPLVPKAVVDVLAAEVAEVVGGGEVVMTGSLTYTVADAALTISSQTPDI